VEKKNAAIQRAEGQKQAAILLVKEQPQMQG